MPRSSSLSRACVTTLCLASAALVAFSLTSSGPLAAPASRQRASRPTNVLPPQARSQANCPKPMRRLREISPGSIISGLGASLALMASLNMPVHAAIKKAAPVLNQEMPEVVMDEMHGTDGMLDRIQGWDTNKNGRISREEFEKGMADYVPHELSPGQLDQAWARVQNVELDRRETDPSYSGNILTDEQKQMPQPGQPLDLPTDRVTSSIPRQEEGKFWQYPSPQQAYNAMVRKGKDPDIYRAKDFVGTHNQMNERGWDQVLKYEAVTHPDCPTEGIKLARFNGDYAGRVSGSFDRHYWTINRCGTAEQTYVLDYFDTKQFDEMTMPYSNREIQIDVRPNLDNPQAALDIAKHKMMTGKIFGSTLDNDMLPYEKLN
jgi:cytochrome c heme-lyase